MYKKLLQLINTNILQKYILESIDVTPVLMYRESYRYIFSSQKLQDVVYLTFMNSSGSKLLFEVSFYREVKIAELTGNCNYEDLLVYLKSLFSDHEKNLSKEILNLGRNYSRLKIIYYFFGSLLNYNSFFVLLYSKKQLFQNSEPCIYETFGTNLLYSSSRSKIYRNGDVLEKRSFWINSIFGTSYEQIFYNSIFLSELGYLEKVILNSDGSMSTWYKYKKSITTDISLKRQIDSLINLNKKTFLGYHNGLKISYIQEDPNKDNFVGDEVIDFDVVNISYAFLQPIYLILDLIMGKDFSLVEVFRIFKYVILFFLGNKYYSGDFKLLGYEKVFYYYNRIYIKGLEENNAWLLHDAGKLKDKKNLLTTNKENILTFLKNEINKIS